MCIGLTITVREVRILKRVYMKRSTNHVYIKMFTTQKCVYIKSSTNHVYIKKFTTEKCVYINKFIKAL